MCMYVYVCEYMCTYVRMYVCMYEYVDSIISFVIVCMYVYINDSVQYLLMTLVTSCDPSRFSARLRSRIV